MTIELLINLLIQGVASFVATASFAIVFHCPKSHLFFAGLTGSFGWVVYAGLIYYNINTISASFFATIALTYLARILSFKKKSPVTMFLIPGIFPLVPGIGIYQTGYSLFMSDNLSTVQYGVDTLSVAVAMAVGMGLILTLPQIFFTFKSLNRKGNNT